LLRRRHLVGRLLDHQEHDGRGEESHKRSHIAGEQRHHSERRREYEHARHDLAKVLAEVGLGFDRGVDDIPAIDAVHVALGHGGFTLFAALHRT